jgi:hypothetical protein
MLYEQRITSRVKASTWQLWQISKTESGTAAIPLAFADKCIGAGGEGGLMAGIQMTDNDDDNRIRTGQAQLSQGLHSHPWI